MTREQWNAYLNQSTQTERSTLRMVEIADAKTGRVYETKTMADFDARKMQFWNGPDGACAGECRITIL